jgi:uncharacterized coiled-coil DUF342 family protein
MTRPAPGSLAWLAKQTPKETTVTDTPASLNTPEPAPTSGGVEVWPLVIKDMQERAAIGAAKYGVPLTAGNGRRPLVDAYQEALDLSVYLRQAIEEEQAREAAATDLLVQEQVLRHQYGTEAAQLRAEALAVRGAVEALLPLGTARQVHTTEQLAARLGDEVAGLRRERDEQEQKAEGYYQETLRLGMILASIEHQCGAEPGRGGALVAIEQLIEKLRATVEERDEARAEVERLREEMGGLEKVCAYHKEEHARYRMELAEAQGEIRRLRDDVHALTGDADLWLKSDEEVAAELRADGIDLDAARERLRGFFAKQMDVPLAAEVERLRALVERARPLIDALADAEPGADEWWRLACFGLSDKRDAEFWIADLDAVRPTPPPSSTDGGPGQSSDTPDASSVTSSSSAAGASPCAAGGDVPNYDSSGGYEVAS